MAGVFRILSIVLLFGTLHAGGSLTGTVTDIANGNPIQGAAIALIKGGTFILSTTTTAADGSYSFSNIPQDSYTVRTTASGYQTLSIGATIRNNLTTTVDFSLEHNPGSIVGKVRDSSSLGTLEGATVQVIKDEVIIASATTTDSGAFFVGNLAAGNYTIRASTKNYQTYAVGSTVLPNQSVTVNFFLQPQPGTILGRVLSSTTSEPLQEAIVDVLQDMMVIASTRTDNQGYYTIPSLATGSYVVRVSTSNYQIDSVGATVSSLLKTTVNLSLQPNPGGISGKVTNEATAYPIAGATITIFRDTINLATEHTDPQGNYTIHDLAPGNYIVRVHATNYETRDVGAAVVSDLATPIDLAMKSDPGSVGGHILDTNSGKPLSGVLVRVFKENDLNGSAYTDQDGNYTISGLAPDTYIVTAQKNHYQTFALGGEISANAATTVNFGLSPQPRKITGVVTIKDHSDAPVSDAVVTVYSGTTFYAIGVTDKGGNYTINTLPPNFYSVKVSASNYQIETLPADLFSNLSENINFDLTPFPGTIKGRVVQSSNSDVAIAGAVITSLDGTTLKSSTLSDIDGYFTLTGLAPGTYTIRASSDNFITTATTLVIQSNQTLFQDFSLAFESIVLSGRVIDVETGAPIASASVHIFQDGHLIVGELTDANGHFSTDELEPGFYVIRINAKNYKLLETDFHTSDDMNFSLESIPAPPGSITGIIETNRFLTQSDRIHKLNWQTSVSQNITRYDVYRDGAKIASQPAHRPLAFRDHRRSIQNKYEVRAIDRRNRESIGVTVSLR